MSEEKKENNEEKSETQKQLEEYRKTGKGYLSEEDMDIDFSKVDEPKKENQVSLDNNNCLSPNA